MLGLYWWDYTLAGAYLKRIIHSRSNSVSDINNTIRRGSCTVQPQEFYFEHANEILWMTAAGFIYAKLTLSCAVSYT